LLKDTVILAYLCKGNNTQPEITTLAGHSLRDVATILDAHYLNRDPALADSAIKKLELRTKIPD
jgi:hypothetical protein